jgi:hypothetical protein
VLSIFSICRLLLICPTRYSKPYERPSGRQVDEILSDVGISDAFTNKLTLKVAGILEGRPLRPSPSASGSSLPPVPPPPLLPPTAAPSSAAATLPSSSAPIAGTPGATPTPSSAPAHHMHEFVFIPVKHERPFLSGSSKGLTVWFRSTSTQDLDTPLRLDATHGNLYIHQNAINQTLQVWLYDLSNRWKLLSQPEKVNHPVIPDRVLKFRCTDIYCSAFGIHQ